MKHLKTSPLLLLIAAGCTKNTRDPKQLSSSRHDGATTVPAIVQAFANSYGLTIMSPGGQQWQNFTDPATPVSKSKKKFYDHKKTISKKNSLDRPGSARSSFHSHFFRAPAVDAIP
ncbi:MAG TPA: hypothetical protein VH396_09570 [Chitinophagaceae bacterium]|jgi:hypothetical protein